ncbi:PREDICTED: putative serine protease F56F10.1 isoform X1 [Bactrocera latifrons]|nr:PREDICTED: putative serine protease F56F10.1 isoform X1 [Bactrocera latifrons]XP_018795348.1 PREDICTED: putative serine protease F56F10.1 isoform X1 [Bactrocera latifrons]
MSGSLSILIIDRLQLTTICLLIFTFNNLDNAKAFGPRRSALYTIDETSQQLTPDDTPEPQENWFQQKLDHFDDKQENITWKQRYFMNDAFYRNDSDAPIFLTIGGELAISPRWVTKGSWIKFAEHFGAMCFHLEHRFYGKSQPKSDLSYENLKFLTSQQALADVAYFIRSMNVKYNFNSKQKWIVFGGSYPGALAAWARQKYPHLIYGAISSSAPLLAKVDFFEYLQVVKASLTTHSDNCLKALGRAFAELETLIRQPIGQRSVNEKFNICTPIEESATKPLDMSNFFQKLADNIAFVVQFNKVNRPEAYYTIDEACNVMVNDTIGPPFERLGIVNGMVLENLKEKCLDYKYDNMLTEMRNISLFAKVANGTRQWTYQTCNEFGFYQTSNDKNDTFGDKFKVDFFIKQCMDIFSESMDAKYLEQVVSQTNEFYGGLNPNSTNVLYVHGSIDPWHALGLTASNNPNIPTVFIEGTAHCAEMYDAAKSDPPQLSEARNKILDYLAQLLTNSKM